MRYQVPALAASRKADFARRVAPISGKSPHRVLPLSPAMTGQEPATYDQEFVVDHIVDHVLDSKGVWFYQIRWYGYPPEEDTWEPIQHLPRSKVITYHRRTRFPLPSTLDMAQVG